MKKTAQNVPSLLLISSFPQTQDRILNGTKPTTALMDAIYAVRTAVQTTAEASLAAKINASAVATKAAANLRAAEATKDLITRDKVVDAQNELQAKRAALDARFNGSTDPNTVKMVAALDAVLDKTAAKVGLLGCPAKPMKNGEIYASFSGSGTFQIWAVSPDGASRRQVTSKERDGLDRASHPSVSPDGTVVAFTGSTGNRADIYVINADGTNLRKVTSSGPNEYQMIPGFSPDGRLIAYTSSRGEPSPSVAHLMIISVDGTGERQLTPTTDGSYEDTGPKFSPCGGVIVFGSDKGNTREHNDIYAINVDGSNERRLTYGADNSYSRSWSPDGRKIVYNSQVGLNGTDPGYGELRIMNADGSHQHALTSYTRNLQFAPVEPEPGKPNTPIVRGDITPAWSPDGKYVAFCGQSESTGQFELFVIDLVTRKRTQITYSPPGTNYVSAAWSVAIR